MTGKLERVTNGKALRTDSVIGEFTDRPTVGRMFYMTGAPLTDEGTVRYVKTSPVVEVNEPFPGVWVFATENSVYRLTQRGDA